MVGTRGEFEKLQEKHRQLVADSTSVDDVDCISVSSSQLERASSDYPDCVSTSLPPETEEIIDELTERVRTLTYQKEKAEKKLEEALAENESLDKSLEKAEIEIDDLAKKLSLTEDPLIKQSLPSTPKHFHSTSTAQPSFSLSENHSPDACGISIFNELDSQFSLLQTSYDSLVEGCTCSASLHHRNRSNTEKGGHGVAVEQRKRNVSASTPFKDLFDEIFANLKQSAKVADRLFENKVQAREE